MWNKNKMWDTCYKWHCLSFSHFYWVYWQWTMLHVMYFSVSEWLLLICLLIDIDLMSHCISFRMLVLKSQSFALVLTRCWLKLRHGFIWWFIIYLLHRWQHIINTWAVQIYSNKTEQQTIKLQRIYKWRPYSVLNVSRTI